MCKFPTGSLWWTVCGCSGFVMASVVSARFLRQEDEVDKVIGHKVVASGDYVYEVLAWCKPFGTDDVSVRVRRTACERDPDLYGACAKVFEYQ